MCGTSFALRQEKKKALFEYRRYIFSKKPRRCLLHVNRRVNNLIFTLTMTNGVILQVCTSGLVKYTKAKSVTPQAAEAITRKLVAYAKLLGVSFIDIVAHIRLNIFVFSVQRGIRASGMKFGVNLRSCVKIPHNGCKKKKKRRV